MVKIDYVGDDFKRMTRADLARITHLAEGGKFGRHKVPYKDKTITIEIEKKGPDITVRRIRVM